MHTLHSICIDVCSIFSVCIFSICLSSSIWTVTDIYRKHRCIYSLHISTYYSKLYIQYTYKKYLDAIKWYPDMFKCRRSFVSYFQIIYIAFGNNFLLWRNDIALYFNDLLEQLIKCTIRILCFFNPFLNFHIPKFIIN